MRRNNSAVLASLAIFILSSGIGCTEEVAGKPGKAKKDQPQFDTWAKEFAANPDPDILLRNPKDWFESQFEPKLAKQLTAEYAAIPKGENGILAFVKSMRSKGKTEIHTRQVSQAIDLKANGLQNAALQRMKNRVVLYTIEFLKPGQSSGTTLWSFAFIDGKYRFLGKMRALNPTRGDLATDVLCQMPLGKTGKMMQEKRLIDRSAVDYLKLKGVLK